MATTSSDKLKSKLRKMATTKKRKRKTTKTVASAPRKRRRSTSAPVKRRRRLGANAPGAKMTAMRITKNTLGGAIGGAIYTVPSFVVGLPWWAKIAWGLGGSIGLNLLKLDHVGAGQAGAMTNDLARSLMPTLLKDGDLEDAEYVNPNTLSDTGFEDELGEAIVMDDSGNVYALNDAGEYQKIGVADDLPMEDDGMEDSNLQSVSMIPLQDVYSLNAGGNSDYSLARQY